MIIKEWIPISYTEFPGNIACVIEITDKKLEMPHIDEIKVIRYMLENKHWMDGIVIRGEEPTQCESLYYFCKRVKRLGFSIKIDTLGFGPLLLKTLINESLVDYISMTLKAPPEKYLMMTGTDFSNVKEAYRLVKRFKNHEFKTEVTEALNLDDLSQIAMLTDKVDYFLHPASAQVENAQVSRWSRALGVRYRGI